MAHYSRRDYWDTRYADKGGDVVEMHLPWARMDADIVEAVRTAADVADGRILVPGCGTSRVPEDLHDALRQTEEFKRRPVIRIDCVDWSTTLINALKQRASKDETRRAGISYAVADARRLASFTDGTFGAVVEKGLIDCLLCGTDADECFEGASAAIAELYRVLAPGGVMIHVTHSSRTDGLRSAVFDNANARWSEVSMVSLGGDEDDEEGAAAVAAEPAAKGHNMYIFRK